MAIVAKYASHMPLGTANPVTQNLHEVSSTKIHKMGERLVLEDGRAFRYGSFIAALGDGKLVTSGVAPEPATVDLTAGYAIGLSTIHIDAVGASHAANALAGGYFSDDAGNFYPISGNTAVDSNECDITLAEPLRTALTDDDDIFVAPSYYHNAGACGATDFAIGMPAVEITSTHITDHTTVYGWIQTWGPCVIYMADTTTTLLNVQLTTGAAGVAVKLPHTGDAESEVIQLIGHATADIANGSTSNYVPAFLQLAP